MDSTAHKQVRKQPLKKALESRPETILPWKTRYKAMLTRLILFWEAFLAASWVFWGTLSISIIIILLDIPTLLPIWAHLTFLILAGLLLMTSVILFGIKFKIPDQYAALRRLEKTNQLSHRPLSSISDRPLKATKSGLSLWLKNKKRLEASLSSLTVPLPRPLLFKIDPYGLRSLVIFGLFVSAFSYDQWPNRITTAFDLNRLIPSSQTGGVKYSMWLTPPDYTGAPPLFFDKEFSIPEQLDLPQGSRALVQVHGLEGSPNLELSDTTIEMERTGETSHESTFVITESGTLSIATSFRTLLNADVNLLVDQNPEIRFMEKPQENDQGLLKISFETEDDYGTNILEILFWQDDPNKAEIIKLPLPASQSKKYEGQYYLDLTDHVLAGEQVWFQLATLDALDQKGNTETIKITVPERPFTHPLARQLVNLRKDLNIPENKGNVIAMLGGLVKRPDYYEYDTLVALTMTIAGKHLLFDTTSDAKKESQELLWKTALHLEDGRLSTAQRDLRDIQKQLQEALSSQAPPEEINRLMDKLQQAVDSLLAKMLEQFLTDPEQENPPPLPEGAKTLDGKDLQKLIDQARMLAENGSMEEAMQLLSELQNMLENLAFQQGPNPQDNAGDKGRETFEKLQNLTKRQEELLENSYQRQQEQQKNTNEPKMGNQPSSRTTPGGGRPGNQKQSYGEQQARDARSQERLRQELEQLMENIQELLGNIPEDFDQAEQSMGMARDALQGQDGDGKESDQVVRAQTRSLRKLQNGTEQAAEKYLKMLNQAPERGSGWVRGKDGSGKDPFGRNIGNEGGSVAKRGVPLPDEADFLESRRILQELRDRRNDRARTKDERIYIQRLLDRF
ncbi:DUF4175 domain-containing protein [Kiloniella antarctica]|uniref:DUF4175 domain-containing protein n=1 Tax=Kiloniella antarctica TaxID=1550907 RepID=A0ABW5BII4_9PROT